MFTERTGGLLSDCEPTADALHGGYRFAYLIGPGRWSRPCGALVVGEEWAESKPAVPPGRHNERGGSNMIARIWRGAVRRQDAETLRQVHRGDRSQHSACAHQYREQRAGTALALS